jgi:hypothetical protein
MKILKLFFFVIVSSKTFSLYAQDKIYLATDIKQGRILNITSDNIEYRSSTNTNQVLSIAFKSVRILFNAKGDYLIPYKMNISAPGFKHSVDSFTSVADSKMSNPKDVLYTNENTRIEGSIAIEDDFYVLLTNGQKLAKNDICAIIYTTGNIKIYGQLDSVAAVLWTIQQNTKASQNISGIPAQAAPNNTLLAQAKADSARKLAFEQVAGGISKKDFEDRSILKTNKLNEYLKILCSKTASYEKSNEATDQAVNLFVNEDARVVTSSIKTSTVNSYRIRDYLTRVKLFKYDKIEIEWTHVQYVSDLKMGKDGNFYGVVSFEQVFRGYRDNQLVYSDITKKNAEVVLKTYNKNYEGETKTVWDVLLSDIGVVYTKADE